MTIRFSSLRSTRDRIRDPFSLENSAFVH